MGQHLEDGTSMDSLIRLRENQAQGAGMENLPIMGKENTGLTYENFSCSEQLHDNFPLI